jgi:hypothetical protein
MKTTERSLFKNLAVATAAILLAVLPAAAAQVQKTFTWKYPVNRETHIKTDNYNCDLVIHGWEKSETEYHLTVEATGKTQDDEKRLISFLENYSFSHSGDEVVFKNSFWKNRRTINGRTTIEIPGEKDIELTDFTMKGELWIPAGSSYELDSKYSRIDMGDLNGKLSLSLYNDNLFGSNLTAVPDIEAKYASIEFKDLKGVNAELYNCNFTAASSGALSADSKYSKFNIKNAGNVTVTSYNDNFTFSSTGNLKLDSKYSDLKSDLSGNVILNCYNGTIEITSAKNVQVSSKYAEFRLGTTEELEVGDTYNDKFVLGNVSLVNVNVSKYSNFKIAELGSGLVIGDGYNDNVLVSKSSASLKEVKVTAKYEDISLALASSLSFRLQADIKYPSLHIDEGAFKTKQRIEDNSGLSYEAIKGTEKDGMPVVAVKGYNITLTVK